MKADIKQAERDFHKCYSKCLLIINSLRPKGITLQPVLKELNGDIVIDRIVIVDESREPGDS